MFAFLDQILQLLANLFPAYFFLHDTGNLRGLLAVLIVCLVCGAVGSLVVGNRMAFFSDALAHCAFAGVGIGILTGLVAGMLRDSSFVRWGIPLIMVGVGVVIGVAIVFVRERTALASDTVIGVFFAGAIGFGAMLFQAIGSRSYLTPESFLFGNPVWLENDDFFILIVLAFVTMSLLFWVYNRLVFASFNPSLARSRRIPLRFFNYLFVVLLALIVNLSLKTVGALLINALLVVPAATAGILSRNLRQMFWLSIGLSLAAGLGGVWLAFTVPMPDPWGGRPIYFGWGGTIVVLSVLLFFLSMLVTPWLRRVRGTEG